MSFINKYLKESHAYWNSKSQGNVIYSIGTLQVPVSGGGTLSLDGSTKPPSGEGDPGKEENQSTKEAFIRRNDSKQALTSLSSRGLITKTDAYGEVIWEKSYRRSDGRDVHFDDMVYCDNNDIIIVGVLGDDKGLSLHRLDSQGNLIWTKYLPPFQNESGVNGRSIPRLIKIGFESYVVQVDDNFYSDYGALQPENFLFKINGSGQIVNQTRLLSNDSSSKLQITGITKHSTSDHIILYGRKITYHENEARHVGIIIEFDTSFAVVDHYTLFGDDEVDITAAYATSQYYLVYGNLASTMAGFLTKIYPTTAELNITVQVLSNKGFDHCFFNANFIYLQWNDRFNTKITKLTHNFNILWNKNFDTGNYNYKAIRQVLPTKIILANYFVASLNLELNSCLTSKAESTAMEPAVLRVTPKLDFQMVQSNRVLQPYELLIDPVSSKKERLCPTELDDNFPEIGDNTLLQSPNFYLQAAGSLGNDSSKGIHLRWIFSGVLGDNHLPKGNNATLGVNFNKPNDFVKVYRANYVKEQFTLDLTLPPQAVNDSQKFWLYKFNDDTRVFFVYFRNTAKYASVRAQYNPISQAFEFIKAYGDELIEVENKRELFFATELQVEFESGTNSALRIEALSVAANTLLATKSLAYRRTYSNPELDSVRTVNENGRSIRYRTNGCLVTKIYFEFYSDFISKATNDGAWTTIGDFALSLDTSTVFNQLDPEPDTNPVNGSWLRYNDGAYTNLSNYQDKWHGPVQSWNRNIKDIVTQYINLSNAETNPRALEYVTINLANESDVITVNEAEVEEGSMEVSNLDMLRLASYDYHVARMLGLGTLDIRPELFSGDFIYVAAYTTFGDLGIDPVGEINHLSMTLPTSIETERLPLPVDLKELVPGILNEEGIIDIDATDAEGYSFDGKKRYISIYCKELIEGDANPPFYATPESVDASTFTLPVYAGLESRSVLPGENDNGVWTKPELSHKKKYLNIDSASAESYETTPMFLPEQAQPLYIDIHTKTGNYYYAGYGINWFSRATSSIDEPLQIHTNIKPVNSLLPPSNVHSWLIKHENPLMYTSQTEQQRLMQIPTDSDKTLIRLIFDYNADQDLISYQVPHDSPLPNAIFESDENILFPDDDEVLGDKIEINFRRGTPRSISAKARPIVLNMPNIALARIQTQSYFQASTGDTLPSQFPAGTSAQNFIGSIFVNSDLQLVIHNVEVGQYGLDFIVYKQQIGDNLFSNTSQPVSSVSLQMPVIEGDGYFTVVENMQNVFSWGGGNPNSFQITIGDPSWNVHRELVKFQNDNGLVEKYIEKTRGFWEEATVEKVLETFTFEYADGDTTIMTDHRGIYKITFNSLVLGTHLQSASNVEWFNGSVRLFTNSNYVGSDRFDSRKTFTVFKTENIGSTENLVLYINDPTFAFNPDGSLSAENDDIVTGGPIMVNYYPSYKLYLYHNPAHNLTESVILPEEGEGTRMSIFGLRTIDNNYTTPDGSFYKSKFSIPSVLLAQEVIDALPPKLPMGGLFATRPDFYGKSTYTFVTEFVANHKPHGVSFYRGDDQGFLSALYEVETINEIRSSLKAFGANDEEFLTDRWVNFFKFDQLAAEGHYEPFPITVGSDITYQFPLPDKAKLFQEINRYIHFHNMNIASGNVQLIPSAFGTITLNTTIITNSPQDHLVKFVDFVREAVMNVFVPLTEVPIIYKYIKTVHTPNNKKQKIRDENGYLIKPPENVNQQPQNSEFDMAPMMKIVSGAPNHKTQFTDFTLDGTSNNLYFYAVKEVSSLMKMGDFSPVLGPIKLINSNPPEAPKVKSILPQLENRTLGITPAMRFEINSYPAVQNIKKINLYRTFNRLDAESVQSMELIKVVDVEAEGMANAPVWSFTDAFTHLLDVPFADALYYRISVSRKVSYEDLNQDVIIEYAPSQASKIHAAMIVEAYKPDAPVLAYFSEPLTGLVLNGIVLHWEKTCYKGKYHLYKMNSQGNWVKIHEVAFNDIDIYLPLGDTDLASGNLQVLSGDGINIYHHFKVVAENSAGMMSSEENILTIYNEATWQDVGGVGEMRVVNTFVVR